MYGINEDETSDNEPIVHITAHDSGSNITFNDLMGSYEDGHKIVDVFHDVINKESELDRNNK